MFYFLNHLRGVIYFMTKKSTMILLISVLVLSGCANSLGIFNKTPSNLPPELIRNTTSDNTAELGLYNNQIQNVSWSKLERFGSVPEALKNRGDQLCQQAGFTNALGYHPHPLGINGEIIADGGFLCEGYRN